jgi:exodeoxyribonuclease X
MTVAIILDTETTCVDEPAVIELAHTGPLAMPTIDAPRLQEPGAAIHSYRYNPGKPISYGAMAVHHILDEDVANEPPWPGTWKPPEGTEYLIGHSIDFDWRAVGEPPVKRICTLAFARSLWPELDSHSLGALTYRFMDKREAKQMLARAHTARVDVALVAFLLVVILEKISPVATWEELWQRCELARMPERMTFGKYGKDSDWAKANNKGHGMRCGNVREYDPGYWDWLMTKCDQVRDDVYLQRALRGERK